MYENKEKMWNIVLKIISTHGIVQKTVDTPLKTNW